MELKYYNFSLHRRKDSLLNKLIFSTSIHHLVRVLPYATNLLRTTCTLLIMRRSLVSVYLLVAASWKRAETKKSKDSHLLFTVFDFLCLLNSFVSLQAYLYTQYVFTAFLLAHQYTITHWTVGSCPINVYTQHRYIYDPLFFLLSITTLFFNKLMSS